uniref:Putative mediator of RNA polymerase II transcription subunit 26c n=1 Tax=Davidia involucrata TaxID=16924 RepID=A0A5B6Z9S2_DAVIN
MDSDKFRSIMMNSGVDMWTLIETAISVASMDCEIEFKHRREAIVERLYTPGVSRCRNCDIYHQKPKCNSTDKYGHQSLADMKESIGFEVKGGFDSSPVSVDRDEDDEEQSRVLAIKEHLEDPDQSVDCLVDMLRSLAEMDITFKALKETDIGRHVNRLRKHSSNEVRRLVKQLIRKWKDLVDEWVRLNTPEETAASPLVGDGDSPYQNHQKSIQNGHHQVIEQEKVIPHIDAPTKPVQSKPASGPYVTPSKDREVRASLMDPEKLALATKRLHENYQEAQNAKKQRTIQVMDLHHIPKPKYTFFAKNRG